jgi:hypothetical protein
MTVGVRRDGKPDPEFAGMGSEMLNEKRYTVADLAPAPKKKFIYEYDSRRDRAGLDTRGGGCAWQISRLAARFGVSRSAIHWRRKKLGIPPLRDPTHRPWIQDEVRLLGTMPDKAFASKFGRSPGATKMKRLNLKIPAFHP